MSRQSWHSLPEYQALRALMQGGTTTSAAEILGLSQSAVSQHIANLAATLGAQVLIRGRDGVTLTPLQRTVPGAVVLDVGDAVARAGLYRVVQGERTLRVVAVNEDARESAPTALRPAEAVEQLEAATGRPVRLVEGAADLTANSGSRGTPLWTVFLALALACLVAETLITTRLRPAAAS